MKPEIKSEDHPNYGLAFEQIKMNDENAAIERALAILAKRLKQNGPALSSPQDVKNYLRLYLAEKEYEVFMVLHLDNQHAVISIEELFRGTIDGASVYPREVVKHALAVNAAAVIFAHNHPSGMSDPSVADERLTTRLKAALGTVDIRVLDHMIVGGMNVMSFAERGLL